jgi:CBS domain-containing protein
MKLQEILSAKSGAVQSISPDATLKDAAQSLVEKRIGSLVVFASDSADEQVLAGIITERDILHACAGDRPLADVKVGEAMSTKLVTGKPDDEVEQVMGLMTTRRIRHLPVFADGRLAGIISIGDVVKAQHDQLAIENQFMKDYIGRPR